MTCLAVPDAGGEADARKIDNGLIETDDLIFAAGLDARQFLAHVNFVDHHGHVDGVARIGISGLRGVADDAEFNFPARSAVRAQRIMALVASRGLRDVANIHHRAAGRHKVEDFIGVLIAELELVQISRRISANGMRRGSIITLRSGRAESVPVFALSQLFKRAARIRRGLSGRFVGDWTGLDACDVRGVLRLARWNDADDEANGHRAGRNDAFAIERLILWIGDTKTRADDTAGFNLSIQDLEH